MYRIIVLLVLSVEPYVKGLGCDLQTRTSSWKVHCLGYLFVYLIRIEQVFVI